MSEELTDKQRIERLEATVFELLRYLQGELGDQAYYDVMDILNSTPGKDTDRK